NWNENLKLQKLEVQMLKELKSDVLQTKKEIITAVEGHNKLLRSGQYLLDAMRLKLPYSDSINQAFLDMYKKFEIVPKTSGFENLKTIGLNTISDDSLRIAITNLFQLRFTRLPTDMLPERSAFDVESLIFPYQIEYQEVDFSKPRKLGGKYLDTLNLYHYKIRDYKIFTNDMELFKILQLSTSIRRNIIGGVMNVSEEIDAVVVMIDKELEKK
ncbi:MAG: hypothetical protein NWQ38_13580, partial [Cellulophaga sp.]|nr:hypothetical protein [Cellulophaga sp.]